MNKFFYYNSLCEGSNTQSVFSIDPFVTAIKELLVSELKQVVYYIEKLRDFDFDMTSYTDKVIEFITILIVNLDFKKENTFVIIEDLYNNKKMLEKMYISACEKSDEEIELYPENTENLSSKDIILKALNEKEKDIKTGISGGKLSKNRKYLYEIMMNIVLNACNRLIELKNLGINAEEAKHQVLRFFNKVNIPSLTDEELKEFIKDFAKSNYENTKCYYKTLNEKFGPVIKTSTEICQKEGNAILVSGTGFDELEKILEAVNGLNIKVYSYHEMISAFQYEKFNQNANFVGHYGKSTNNLQSDFAAFPGPIFVTRNSMPKIDVIRGRIFTSAKYPAFGISKIENENFEPLIQSAMEEKGFDKDYSFKTIKIGYNKEDIENGINDILKKYRNREIKNIIIIGLADRFNFSDSYVEEFLNLNHEENYIISFANESDRPNFINVNSYLDFEILYEIIEHLTKEIPEIKNNISVFLADCNNSTITHIFNFLYLEVKNVFLGACCPNVISPVLVDGLEVMFDVKPLTTAQKDLERINN